MARTLTFALACRIFCSAQLFVDTGNKNDPPIDLAFLFNLTDARARSGLIDPVVHLKHTPLYLYSGLKDSVVAPPVMYAAAAYFEHYVDPSAIKGVWDVPSDHGYVTNGYGACCACVVGPQNCSVCTFSARTCSLGSDSSIVL